jgi:TRAP-type transport system small permease protein
LDTADTGESGAPPIVRLHERHGGRIDRALQRVNSILHMLAGVTMVLLLLWTVGDIIGRTAFSRPFPGTVELTELAVVMLVYLGLARAENADAHITVDLLFARLGVRARLALRIAAGLVSAAVVAILTWRLAVFAGQLQTGGFTTGVLRIPLYPVAIVGVLGASAFLLAILSNVVVSVRALVRDR